MTHSHHDHERVVERDSSTSLIVGVILVLLVIFLAWAIFFSGWVVDTDNGEVEAPTQIEQQEGDTNLEINEGDQTDDQQQPDTETSPEPETSPAP